MVEVSVDYGRGFAINGTDFCDDPNMPPPKGEDFDDGGEKNNFLF